MVSHALPGDFEAVYPLLNAYDPAVSRADWQRLYLGCFPHDEIHSGYLLRSGENGPVIGYAGYLFSRRPFGEEVRPFCNLSSWVISPEWQGKGRLSHQLLQTACEEAARLASENHVAASFSSIPSIVRMLRKSGFQDLDAGLFFLPPLGLAVPRGSWTDAAKNGYGLLTPMQRQIVDDHRQFRNVYFPLMQTPAGNCLLVAKKKRIRGITVLRVHHISDPALFLSYGRGLLPALCLRWRVAGVLSEQRYLHGEVPRGARQLQGPPQVYAGSMPPQRVDALYSELFVLDFG